MLYKAFAILATILASVSATGTDREGPASLESAKLVTVANRVPLKFDLLADGATYPFNAELGYTILAIPKGGLNSVEFYVGQPGVKSEEFGAPYYLAGDNGAGEVNTSPYLSTCGPKIVKIVGKAGSGAVLFTNTFSFTLACRCVSSFVCPVDSVAATTCVQSINDCNCNTGFVKSGNSCVPECPNPFTCPSNSVPIKACVQSIKDCGCGFVGSPFTCPANSLPINFCVRSINDCSCNTGFVKSGNFCVPECPNPFTCPANSSPIKACVQSINDCSCFAGFVPSGGLCVPKCFSTFTCPRDFVPIGDCVRSINDCRFFCPASTRVKPEKFQKCLDKGYSCAQCTNHFEKHRRRNLQEINARHLVESNQECAKEEYDMFLVVDGGHFAGLATPKDGSECPSVVFHAQAYENDSELKKIALQASHEDLVDLAEENKLHLGTKSLTKIVHAFETAPVSKEGALYDVISNNCVVMLRNMADPLDIPVDERMLGFITKKLTSSASEHILDMMKESPSLNMIYEGSRRMLKGVSTDDLLAKVIKLYV